MGQSEVYECMKKHSNKWFNSMDLAKILNVKINVVNRAFVNLRRFNLIYRKMGEGHYHNSGRSMFYYKIVPDNKVLRKGARYNKDELVDK